MLVFEEALDAHRQCVHQVVAFAACDHSQRAGKIAALTKIERPPQDRRALFHQARYFASAGVLERIVARKADNLINIGHGAGNPLIERARVGRVTVE